ncbi:MAG: LysM peptidoglycan-binding domain-containing M23 family metallopeptidase [Chloroflexota bacterium]
MTLPNCFTLRKAITAIVIGTLCTVLYSSTFSQIVLFAQDPTEGSVVQSYTVQPGDTLGAIADRFGIPMEQLIEFNQIENPNLIEVNQVLRIPSADYATNLLALPVETRQSLPGENLAMFAQRLNQDLSLLAALNQIGETQRLFPQRSIKIPLESIPSRPLQFGAVRHVQTPSSLIQGETGRLYINTTRPLSLTTSWNGLPVTFSSWKSEGNAGRDTGVDTDDSPPIEPPTEDVYTYFALLPVPALLAPQAYPVAISYVANNGRSLQRTWFVQVAEGNYDSQEILLTGETATLLAPEFVEAELNRLIEVWTQRTPLLWLDTFVRPIGIEYPTTSPFGTRRSYNGGPYNSYHSGQDFGAPIGVPIIAPAPGTIVLAEALKVRGNAVMLDHGAGIFTGYWHLNEIHVAIGQQVNKGDVLGLVGTTGLSTGAHLHWELRIYGIGVNPMQFIDEPLWGP